MASAKIWRTLVTKSRKELQNRLLWLDPHPQDKPMRFKTAQWIGAIALGISAAGCIHSHHAPVAYEVEPVPTPQTVIVTPASERPVVRVYPKAGAGELERSTQSADLSIADKVRSIFEKDPALAAAARNVSITVNQGSIVVAGRVETYQDRSVLLGALGGVPGIKQLADRTQIGPPL